MKLKQLCLLSAVLVFVLSSCKKEADLKVQQLSTLSDRDARIGRLVSEFKVRMSSELKSSDSLSVDSTLWYIEITANYTYGNATVKNESVSVDSSFHSVPVNNGMISMEDINTTYADIIDAVRSHYYSVQSSEKHLLAVIVKQEELTSGELTVKVLSTVVSGPYTGNFTFQPWENWMYGMGLGMCDGSFQGRDAASEIARRIMLRKAVPTGYYYYEPYPNNPVYISADYYPVPNVPASNICSHYMWWEDSNLPDFHLCIPSNELNFYLTGTEHVIYNIELPAGGYSFMNILYLEGSLILNTTRWVHYGEVNYGILHISNDPPEDL